MKLLPELFESNEKWAQRTVADDPEFFTRLMDQQAPQFFWIGCSDSRVPSTQITGLVPGEIFVHRNVANLVSPWDPNSLSALQYATEFLRVRHFIICGHYGCGGVRAAMEESPLPGPLGQWLHPVRELFQRHRRELDTIADEHDRWDRMCELNVVEQVRLACNFPMVISAWERGQPLAVHGWIYSVRDGRLRDLEVTQTIQAATANAGTA